MHTRILQKAEAEVRARSKALVTAEETGDYQKAVSFFASEAVIHPPDAPQFQGHEPLLEVYETVLAQTTEFEGTTTAITPSSGGDMAWEYGINRFVFETPAGIVEAFGKYVAVWQKIDREWLVAALAYSNNSPPPA